MDRGRFGKLIFATLAPLSLLLASCSVNPATGRSQFDALMPREAEASIGAEQHEVIIQQYGGIYNNARLQNYLNEVGQKVARDTERGEVTYKFTLLDSPIVNAFALPGGYVYITRGLMAVANSEAELAGVLAHEIAHVTARHQAARYSQGLLTTLGATIIGAAVGDANVTRALSLGNNLYISSYSRDQESEADMLGIRYLSRAGYDTFAMSDFLHAMDQYETTESRIKGQDEQTFSFFSSHPQTGDRVARAAQEAGRYQGRGIQERDRYLSMINGMTYGDSVDQGVTRGNVFYHPRIGFSFAVPPGYNIVNQPDQVAAVGSDGAVIVLDMASNKGRLNPVDYMIQDWMKGERMSNPEAITINGMRAATDAFPGTLNGRPVDVRLVAIQWSPEDVFRFQIAIPQGVGAGTVEDLKRSTYSFRRMTESERASIRPQRIEIVAAKPGDTVETFSRMMVVDKAPAEMFRALNTLSGADRIEAGQRYKIVAE